MSNYTQQKFRLWTGVGADRGTTPSPPLETVTIHTRPTYCNL